jgi:hypothetical protein
MTVCMPVFLCILCIAEHLVFRISLSCFYIIDIVARFYIHTYTHTYVLTYLLIPWSKVLLDKLTGFQLVKKFSTFNGTQRFITAFTIARHLSRLHQSISPGPRLTL